MPSPVPVWPRFLLSGEGVVRTREGRGSPAPCDPNSRVPQLPRGVIYSQASYCFDIVACTVPFLFFFCLFLFLFFKRCQVFKEKLYRQRRGLSSCK